MRVKGGRPSWCPGFWFGRCVGGDALCRDVDPAMERVVRKAELGVSPRGMHRRKYELGRI